MPGSTMSRVASRSPNKQKNVGIVSMMIHSKGCSLRVIFLASGSEPHYDFVCHPTSFDWSCNNKQLMKCFEMMIRISFSEKESF